jgi:hypothetical protein
VNEEEEEEEEIILHLCHDRKKATHKTKNSKICCQLVLPKSPFPFPSFPFFLSFLVCKETQTLHTLLVNSIESKYSKKRYQLEEHNNTTTTTTTTTTRDYNIMVIT